MLREDTKFMLKCDWEPKVPSAQKIIDQVNKNKGKIAGNVRFSNGRVKVNG